jgi:hypothetical protein
MESPLQWMAAFFLNILWVVIFITLHYLPIHDFCCRIDCKAFLMAEKMIVYT